MIYGPKKKYKLDDLFSFTKECNTFVNMMVLGQFCSGLTSQALCMFELSVVSSHREFLTNTHFNTRWDL